MKSAAIVLILIALVLLLGILGLAALYFGDGKTILLPGLVIVIPTSLLIIIFIVVEVAVLAIAKRLWQLAR
jgi:TM2 domain-containing membrane protein YozV